MRKPILLFLFLFLLVSVVQAVDFSKCTHFDEHYCVDSNDNSLACQGGGYACPFKVGDMVLYTEYYCEYAESYSVVYCENKCNPVTGLCNEGWRQCSEGFMECGLDNQPYDNIIYKCIGGVWQQQENCNDFDCYEYNYNYAFCDIALYYCVNNNYNCVKCSDSTGYETLEECKANLVYFCKVYQDQFSGYCVERLGGCFAGEGEMQCSDLELCREICANWETDAPNENILDRFLNAVDTIFGTDLWNDLLGNSFLADLLNILTAIIIIIVVLYVLMLLMPLIEMFLKLIKK